MKQTLILALVAGALMCAPAIFAKELKDYTAQDVAELRSDAERGRASYQCNLGFCYEKGYGVEQDYREAAKWYRKSAEQGNAEGQSNLGVCYEKGYGVEQDYREAVKWYRKSAEQGNAWGQNNLGICYQKGYGVEQSWTEAVKWFRKSAEQGNAQGQNSLGVCYRDGNGVERDYREAVKWYRKSAEQGNSYGQGSLGECYYNGYSVERDYREAVKWYRKSAEQGNAYGQCYLGFCYEKGYGVEQDYREAVKWYRKSAEQGNARGQCNLGECYAKGWGVKADRAEARKWFEKAADQEENADVAEEAEKWLAGVDFSVPAKRSSRRGGNVFVCVIANEDYSAADAEDVEFARNDGEMFAEYARRTLGVPAKNVRVVTDASAGKMNSAVRWLLRRAETFPDAELIFYYAGHGVPAEKGGKVFLLPTDVAAEDAEFSGIETGELLEKLGDCGAAQTAVFLDACFSGMTRADKPQIAARGVRMKAPAPEGFGNMMVFTAASGDETALGLKEERHGVFTWCLLKKLQETRGRVSWRELGEYLRERVPQVSVEANEKIQTPTWSCSEEFLSTGAADRAVNGEER